MATEFVVYCNRCGAKMVDISTHPGKQAWICEDCGDQDELDISIFVEDSKVVLDYRNHICGTCIEPVIARVKSSGNVESYDQIADGGNYGHWCRKRRLWVHGKLHACPDYEPRKLED